MDLVFAVLAFLVGCGILLAEYRIARKALNQSGNRYMMVSTGRMIINVGYLVLLYFLSRKLSLNLIALLAGGALGLTIPNIFFTSRLMKETSAQTSAQTTEPSSGQSTAQSSGQTAVQASAPTEGKEERHG